jgi:hypothetical protein
MLICVQHLPRTSNVINIEGRQQAEVSVCDVDMSHSPSDDINIKEQITPKGNSSMMQKCDVSPTEQIITRSMEDISHHSG